MNLGIKIVIGILIIIILGFIVFPIINRRQFNKLPMSQKIRIIMKQANKLVYWKNISSGSNGNLIYVKNKRKILVFSWTLKDGNMNCGSIDNYKNWFYPEEKEFLTKEELQQLFKEIEKYNKKHTVRIVFDD